MYFPLGDSRKLFQAAILYTSDAQVLLRVWDRWKSLGAAGAGCPNATAGAVAPWATRDLYTHLGGQGGLCSIKEALSPFRESP